MNTIEQQNREHTNSSFLEIGLDEPCHLIHSDWEYARNISGTSYKSESEEIRRDY